MQTMTNPDYRHCERVGRTVAIGRTEGRCRDRNRCQGPACPLADGFGRDGFGLRARRLSGSIGLSWLGA